MNNQNQKISHLFNLPNLNFKTQMNFSIDSNTHIKTIVNVHPYIYDLDLSSSNGKCNISGKIGAKILYLDVDNVYNTLTEESNFNENISSNELTSNCKVWMFNEQISPVIDYDERYLKLTLNINAKLFANIDLAVNMPDTNIENLIVKKSTSQTCLCVDSFKNKLSLESEITLPQKATKILDINITPALQTAVCNEGYLTISGNKYIQIIYETEDNSSNELKVFNETVPFKFETQATLCEADFVENINLKIDHSSITFSTELTDEKTILKLEYSAITLGCIYKNTSFELVQDLYSTSHEIEANYSKRKFCNISPSLVFKTNVDGEINLLEENGCDEIVDTVNHSVLITNSTVKNNQIVAEGVISSTLIYLSEEKEIKSMQIELPFSFNKEIEKTEQGEVYNIEILPTNCKAKIKRGNVLTLDYEIAVQYSITTCEEHDILENLKFGNAFNYGDIAFQIVVVKENETIWDFCKRTHTSEEELTKNNKEIPPMFQGGEKLLIFRS